jgi:transcriptional regulator with XRE-family HTH domain
MNLAELGQRIRGQREKRGLKQQDVANALNISPQAVSKWERGENAPDIAVLSGLARVLDVSIDWLLTANTDSRDVFQATVLASSFQGAYKKSLDMESRDFATWANGLFYQMTELTLRHDGVPIKYMGDRYLCFFSGAEHGSRAMRAAMRALNTIDEGLKIGLSCGEIYLGSVGHPDYMRPDIMGEVVNIAFLTMEWAETHAASGLGVTRNVLELADEDTTTGASDAVNFLGHDRPVDVVEVCT